MANMARLAIITLGLLWVIMVSNAIAVKVNPLDSRIIGSEIVEKHSIPYQADVIISFASSEDIYRTGSLISPNYVLTAANAVFNSTKIIVVMGVHNVEDKNEPSRRVYEGSEYKVHPWYNKRTGVNDIAVIKLNQSSEINEFIDVAILPHISYILTKPLYGKVARVSGWGTVTAESDPEQAILRYANITVQRHWRCKWFFPHASSTQLCSTDPNKYFEISDIGAPLVLGKVQVGIAVATHTVNGVERSPQIYTRLDLYLFWLKRVTDAIIEW